MTELPVEIPGSPQFIVVKKISLRIAALFDICIDSTFNTDWIEDNTIGIFQHFEFQGSQAGTNMISETTANKRNRLLNIDALFEWLH
jgi:hypothetical protein